MRDVDRQRTAMQGMMGPEVGEDVVSAQWFTPAKGMEDDGLAAIKWVRRRLSSGEHADDRIRGWNILVLTPTRLVMFTARYVRSTPPVRPKKKIGEWPLDRVSVEFRGRKAQSYMASTGSSYTSRIVRATLTFADEDRPLVIDFHDDALTRELLKAAKEATVRAAG